MHKTYTIQRNFGDEWSGCWTFRRKRAATKAFELMHRFGEHDGLRLAVGDDPTVMLAEIPIPDLARHEAMLWSLKWGKSFEITRQAGLESADGWRDASEELWAWANDGLARLHGEWDAIR